MIINWDAIRNKDLRFLIVDLVMTSIAVINLLLIAFDLSYFTLRNLYVHHLPQVAARYDQLKGIEPHRFTSTYIAKAEALLRDYPGLPDAARRQRQDELADLSVQMIEEDPFQRADKSGDLEQIKESVQQYTGVHSSSKQAFAAFWRFDDRQLVSRGVFFRTTIEPIMATNYWRRISTSGRYVDDFFYVDLVFVVIFLTEFAIMWLLAVRRFGPDQKILYPLFHWYDILGCLPLPGLRFLRLFRLFSIAQRLIRSDILTLGDSPIIRLAGRYKAIITEEISDQVAVKILSDIQDKVRLGSGRDVLVQTLTPYKDEIADAVISSAQRLEHRLLVQRHDEWVQVLSTVVEDALAASPEMAQLAKVPLLNRRIARMTSRENIEQLVGSVMQQSTAAVERALTSAEGRAFLEGLVDDVLDETLHLSGDEIFQALLQKINLVLLDELKKGSVTVKKWKAGTSPLPQPNPSLGGS